MADRSSQALHISAGGATAYRLPHRLEGVTTDCGREIHVTRLYFIHRFARTEGVAKKRKLHCYMRNPLPIDILQYNDLGFLGMQFEPALTKPLTNLAKANLACARLRQCITPSSA